jgi:chromosome segregation ATPase
VTLDDKCVGAQGIQLYCDMQREVAEIVSEYSSRIRVDQLERLERAEARVIEQDEQIQSLQERLNTYQEETRRQRREIAAKDTDAEVWRAKAHDAMARCAEYAAEINVNMATEFAKENRK